MQLLIMTALLVMSGVVFYRVSSAIKTNAAYIPLRKQVNIFMSIWMVQLVLRYFGFLFLNAQWLRRNVVFNETNVFTLDKN